MVNELRVTGEIVLPAVLQYEETTFADKRQSPFGYLCNARQGVWRVCKDELELPLARLEKPEDIAANESVVLNAKLGDALANESRMVAVHLYAHHLFASTRKEFKSDAAGTAEEVKRFDILKIHITLKNIKDVLLGKVSSGTRLERTRHIEMPALIFAGYDSHLILIYELTNQEWKMG